MRAAGLLVALIPAVGGAIGWGLLYAHTFCEFAFLAWVIGTLIGIGAASLGSRGAGTAIVCGAFALSSIAAGKVCAVKWSAAEAYAYYYLDDWLSFDAFKEAAEDAKAFAKVESTDGYPKFMVERRYSEAVDASAVTAAEIDAFIENDKEWLEWMYAARPNYTEWRAEVEGWYVIQADELASTDATDMTVVEAVGEALEYCVEPVDALYAVIAMGSAAFFGAGLMIAPKCS